ncbi:MAG: ABC transporter ATP-binding protein [Gemmatimonas sp.]
MMNESGTRPPIAVEELSFAYKRENVLESLSFSVPEGAFYALLGSNGAGKSTLMQVLIGILAGYRGRATVFGQESSRLTTSHRRQFGYVAEGLKLPEWMKLEELERYLSTLYPTWDWTHVRALHERFELDPSRKIGKMSRGQYMKAALLCALAYRPPLLILDEPFTGMDAGVKDELVRGLLAASSAEGCTVVLSSHDISELELLADWVGFLGDKSMHFSESAESLRERFKRVDVVLNLPADPRRTLPASWLSFEVAGTHARFYLADANTEASVAGIRRVFPDAVRVEVADATLKEVFVTVQRMVKAGERRTAAA